MTIDRKLQNANRRREAWRLAKKTGRATGRFMKELAGDGKLCLDTIVDSAAIVVGGNALYAWAADRGLDYVYSTLDKGNGFVTALGYAAVAAGAWAINRGIKINGRRYGLLNLAKNVAVADFHDTKAMIRDARQSPYERKEQAASRRWRWGKTAAIAAAVWALYSPGDFPTTMEKWAWSGKNIAAAAGSGAKTFVHGFARDRYVGQPSAMPPENKPAIKEGQKTLEVRLQSEGPFPVPGYLQGRNLNSFYYSNYTGIYGTAGHTFNPDYNAQLNKLWQQKLGFIASEGEKVMSEVKKGMDLALSEYSQLKNPTRMTLDAYMGCARDTISMVNSNLDWQKLKVVYGISDNQLSLVQNLAGQIDEKMLMAIFLTEMMPDAEDGMKNRLVFDMVLRTAGREFWEFAPAMGDKVASWGPGQMTPEAVYNAPEKRKNKRGKEITVIVTKGASLVNLAMPEDRRHPDSVNKLRGNDHLQAAYQFMINNLVDLVKNLGSNRQYLDNILMVAEDKQTIAEALAAYHHRPSAALKAMKRYLENDCRTELSVSCGSSILAYVERTKTNLGIMQQDVPYDTTPRPGVPDMSDATQAARKPQQLLKPDIMHIVKPGETLFQLSRQYEKSVEEIMGYNKIPNSNLSIGQKLKIPQK